MKARSSVSADISKHVIWVNSTDLESTIRAVKVHEILVNEFGYTDSAILEEGNHGQGVSISVCSRFETVREMREDYAAAKKQERDEPTTKGHREMAKDLLAQLYD